MGTPVGNIDSLRRGMQLPKYNTKKNGRMKIAECKQETLAAGWNVGGMERRGLSRIVSSTKRKTEKFSIRSISTVLQPAKTTHIERYEPGGSGYRGRARCEYIG